MPLDDQEFDKMVRNKKALADELNKLDAWPEVHRGKVTLQDQNGNALNIEGEGYVDEHPEGSDRGGFVPYWERNGSVVHYDENGLGWLIW